MRKTAAAVVLAVGLAAPIGALVASHPAFASATMCGARGCDLYQWGPENGWLVAVPYGTPLHMQCWEDSAWADGTNRWFRVSDWYGTGTNWVNANQVAFQTSVGHC
jgi:hypothetical protein